LKFLEDGKATPKNIDVMKEVLDELKEEGLYVESEDKLKKKKKKKKQPKPEEEEELEEAKPKKKKHVVEEEEVPKKKKNSAAEEDLEEVKPKKKRNHSVWESFPTSFNCVHCVSFVFNYCILKLMKS